MKILILSRNPQLYSIRRLAEEAEIAGHKALIQDPDDADIKKAEPDVVIPRLGTVRFEEALQVLEFFERRRVPVVNRPAALRDARHKWMSHLVLREENLPQPDSRLAMKKEFPRTFPYIAKILDAANGTGVFLISKAEDLIVLPESDYLVQEFISEAKGCDRRLFVIDGRVVAAIERRAPPGDFRSNLSAGGGASSYEPTSLEKDLALQATKALGLRVAGVDLIPSARGPLVLEVNGSPGLEGIEAATGVNVAAALIAAAINPTPRPTLSAVPKT